LADHHSIGASYLSILLGVLSVIAAVCSAISAIFSYAIVRRTTLENVRPFITLSNWSHSQPSVDRSNHPSLSVAEEANELSFLCILNICNIGKGPAFDLRISSEQPTNLSSKDINSTKNIVFLANDSIPLRIEYKVALHNVRGGYDEASNRVNIIISYEDSMETEYKETYEVALFGRAYIKSNKDWRSLVPNDLHVVDQVTVILRRRTQIKTEWARAWEKYNRLCCHD
jgi:hypothetical protein